MACAVNGCKNVKRFKPKGVTFYRFPTESLLKEWLRVLDKGSKWQWTNKLICSEHFSQNDIIKTGVRTKLVSNAVPTLKLLSQASGTCTDQPSISSQSSTEVTRKPVKQKFKRPLGISTSGSSTDSSGRKKVKFIDGQHSTLPRKQNFEFSSEETSLVNPYRSSPQKVRESLRTLASSSSDSSGKRRRTTKFIQSLHNYNISPSKFKKQLINLKKVHTKSRRELYTAKKTIKLLRVKVTTLKTIIDDLKKNCSLSDTAIYHLQKCYKDVPHLLMR